MKTEKINPLLSIITLFHYFLSELQNNLTEQNTENFITRLTQKLAKLKQHLRMEQIEMEPRDFRPMIHATLQELMTLVGSLIAHVDAQELCVPTTPLGRLCHSACHDTNEVINTLARQYAASLPKEIYVPEEYRMITAYQLFHGLGDLVDALKHHDTDPMVIGILMAPFSECIEDRGEMTLAQLNYLKLLKLQLTHAVAEASEKKTPIDEIIQVLFRAINFNAHPAVQYTIQRIYITLKTLESWENQQEFLTYWRMSIIVTPPLQNGVGLYPDLLSVNEQLLKWVNDEHDRLMRMEPVVLNLGPKMSISIPNEHHAFFMKIQIMAEIYACSQKHAAKIGPQIFCTATGEPLGASAYERSFRDIEDNTVRDVLGHFENCVFIIKRDYRHLF